MKRIIFLLVITSIFTACKYDETPEFIRVSSIEVIDYSPESITLASDLIFNNPNHVSGILQADNIKVFINNIDMGTVNSPDFIVPAKNELSVPIEFIFSYKDIFKDPENLLGNILNVATEKKLDVRYVGNLTYKLKVFTYDYPLDYSQEISLK